MYDAFMQTGAPTERVVKLVPGGDAGLARLSDCELLANTRQLVGRSNHVFAALLAHLAEVDSRGLHRTRACASLYTYCIYELRFSEDAAARRAGAAKLVKRFPLLLGAIANGELHLTGLLMLGPHFTPENIPVAFCSLVPLEPRASGEKIVQSVADFERDFVTAFEGAECHRVAGGLQALNQVLGAGEA